MTKSALLKLQRSKVSCSRPGLHTWQEELNIIFLKICQVLTLMLRNLKIQPPFKGFLLYLGLHMGLTTLGP